MDRATDSRTRFLRITGLALTVALLGIAQEARAEAPAIDEYTLDLPTAVNDSRGDVGPVGSPSAGTSRPRVQEGVAGESMPAEDALDAASSLAGGRGAALVLCGLACLVIGIAATRAPRGRTQT
jgi:hypothetical protein